MKALRAAAAVAFILVSSALPALAADRVTIDKLDMSKWPQVRIAVSGGSADDFTIAEGAEIVDDVDVTSFEESGTTVQVMLAIDTSGSMLGEPMTAAIGAARDFVESVPPNIEVGLVTFSDEAHLVVSPTADRDTTLGALKKLAADGETALYDAVVASTKAFGKADQRNIVLLSDGGDTVSTNTLDAALKSAKAGHASIYTVGLQSSEADIAALKKMASKTGGSYSTADVSTLGQMFSGLADTIRNQYVLTYKSTAESGSEFTVAVSSSDGSDSRVLLAPETAEGKATAPKPAPASSPVLRGTTGLLVVLALTFCSLALLVFYFLDRGARQKRDDRLARLMTAKGVDESSEAGETEKSAANWLPDSLVNVAEDVVGKGGWTAGLEHKLERAGSGMRAGELVALMAVFAAGGLIAGLLIGNLLVAIVLTIVGGLAPSMLVSIRGDRRFSTLQSQLPDILMVLASSLRAGHSFLQALDAVANELPDPGGPEFSRVVAEIRLGRPLKEAMDDLGERIASDDFKWAMLAVNIQREVGGNLAEILDTVAETIRGRDYVRRQVSALSAEGRLSMYILGGLPVLVAGWMAMVNPQYIGLLVTSPLGLVMLSVATGLLVLGFLWMRKVVNINV